jgi:hypothetical protein
VEGSIGPLWYPTAALIVSFPSLDARPRTRPSKYCRLAVCVAVLSELPSVVSIGLISSGHEIETFAIMAFGRNPRLINRTRA